MVDNPQGEASAINLSQELDRRKGLLVTEETTNISGEEATCTEKTAEEVVKAEACVMENSACTARTPIVILTAWAMDSKVQTPSLKTKLSLNVRVKWVHHRLVATVIRTHKILMEVREEI